ncbi:hypothetical protein ACH4YN_18280 [Streptomyces griseofuscus]|uniref:hypothetical protein n=1 Tax=Streptomyces griseofuscus TaxID=146922 RepID=UPI0011CDAABB|nr:hypothetical protein [Streptomyces lavendulae]TXJ73940.1 hypothetical protein E2C11_28180 [Streptomyces lavendulae]
MIEYVLDRIPALADRAVTAIRALRRLRDEISREEGGEATPEDRRQKGVEPHPVESSKDLRDS